MEELRRGLHELVKDRTFQLCLDKMEQKIADAEAKVSFR
jgi:hypothetical protein